MNQNIITKSKIVCTLGPASCTPNQIKRLAHLGMDCVRINFSHGTEESKRELFNNVRMVEPKLSILCDIQGPKIRIGEIKEGGADLERGAYVTITTENIIGDEKRISISHKNLIQELKVGELIYINDGIICLKVESIQDQEVNCKILAGGIVFSKKGVNLPSTETSLRVPTEKDIIDLKIIADLNPEYVAISFVGTADDVITVRKALQNFGNKHIKLIAKIERPAALQNFDTILSVSDGIMVARGDLGVELAPEDVPTAQKHMIRKCNIAGKPIIVATQMLESMVKTPVPTRAEVSDVYNAIEDGADAVMLSAETASGDFPAKAVRVMERIIRKSELMFPTRDPSDFDSEHGNTSEIMGHLVFSSCLELSKKNHKGGRIICRTKSGYTARMISKYRPPLPIICVTADVRTAREMKLVWGVEPIVISQISDSNLLQIDRVKATVQACFELGLIENNEKIIFVGNFLDLPTQTNTISIFSASDITEMKKKVKVLS